ncbi:MAG TPA: hypothetical protein VHC48_18985 [Puia sp.]|jgi:hypothetical protein|nr:hypothetical protein [Puia sp.]
MYHRIIVSALLLLCACSKKTSDTDGSTGTKLTAGDLMRPTGNGRTWSVTTIRLTYNNAAGQVDSTITPVSDGYDKEVWFGDNRGVNGLNEVYFADSVLVNYMPVTGSWSLDQARQNISFQCIQGFCNPDRSSSWQVGGFSANAYGASFELTRTQSLPNSRSVHQYIRLFSEP